MKSDTPSYRGYRFPPEIISHGVWLYHRVPQAHKTLDAGCVNCPGFLGDSNS